jgi:hypothetical protein
MPDNDERHYFTELLRGDLNGRFYRHFKGGLYQVIGEGRHSETEEKLVIYRKVRGFGPVTLAGAVFVEFHLSHEFWCRPVEMFHERCSTGRPRFQKLRVCPSCQGLGESKGLPCNTCENERLVPAAGEAKPDPRPTY